LPEFRRDIITDEWVLIAAERAKRPKNFKEEKIDIETKINIVCPFDSGNEHMTPPEILRISSSGKIVDSRSPWQIRVVPNKFPALRLDSALSTKKIGIYDVMNGFGLHEVVINSPEHLLNLNQLSEFNIRLIIETYVRRLREIKKDLRINSVVIMLNQGKDAGASLEHTHSQIFAIPFISPVLEKELHGIKRYYKNNKCCAVCDILNFEIEDCKRKVFENKDFLIIEPFASRGPFETWIIPKKHNSNFENISDEEIKLFAECLKVLVDFFHYELNDASFNYYIHTGPLNTDTNYHYHWHFELMPKLSMKAGFEIATSIDINIAIPEYTADFMKDSIMAKSKT
jgi:UDPglucose--hexose-1-phosphate uridylyltransferase